MLKKIFSCVWFRWNRLLSRIFVRKAELDPSQEFVLLVDEARKEWQWASGLTREFKENDLIDLAIYWQSAAERRYIHLLKQAYREGIKADLGTIISFALADHNNIQGGAGLWQRKHGR
ncbi:MAG: hypothetical protein ACOX4H_09370 [Bacillota bacterium]|jgi:hypothetical protein|nr:hypothetical protein [Clostridia bacterium]